MSANNWTRCPRCTSLKEGEVSEFEKEMADSYGKVTLAEWNTMEKQLQLMKGQNATSFLMDQSFREDYEIYGAAEGTVYIGYSGSCTKCGLVTEFTFEHKFYQDS